MNVTRYIKDYRVTTELYGVSSQVVVVSRKRYLPLIGKRLGLWWWKKVYYHFEDYRHLFDATYMDPAELSRWYRDAVRAYEAYEEHWRNADEQGL